MTNDTNQNHQLRDGARQIAQGVGQVGAGAKEYVDKTLAPTAKQHATRARDQYRNQRNTAGGLLPLLRNYAHIGLIGSAVVLVLGLLLPLGTHLGSSVNYMTAPGSDGPAVLLVLLVAVAGQVALLVHNPKSTVLRIGTGVLALLVGLPALYAAFANTGELGASLALFAIGLGAAGLSAAGVLTLMGRTNTASPSAPADSDAG